MLTRNKPIRVTDENAVRMCKALSRYVESTVDAEWAETLRELGRLIKESLAEHAPPPPAPRTQSSYWNYIDL